jgi:hypothetical protein
MLRFVAIPALALVMTPLPQGSQRAFHKGSLCELYGKGASSTGSFVRFKAIIISDFSQHSAIFDQSCPNKPLSLVLPKVFYYQRSPFMAALYGNTNDLNARRLEVVATGQFVWNQSESPPATIYIDKILKFRKLVNSSEDTMPHR